MAKTSTGTSAAPPKRATPSYRAAVKPPAKSFDLRGTLVAGGGIALVVLVAFGGGYALRSSAGGLPVIEAAAGPVRVKPADSGGSAPIGTDDVGGGAATTEGLAPAAETPNINGLREKFAPKVAAVVPVMETLVASLPPLVSDAHASVPPVAVASVAAPAVAIAAPVRASTVMAAGGIAVQLGALDSEAGAQGAWAASTQRMPDLLAGRVPLLVPASLAGRQVWRLRVAGFADVAAAAGFCAKLRARGADCTVAAF